MKYLPNILRSDPLYVAGTITVAVLACVLEPLYMCILLAAWAMVIAHKCKKLNPRNERSRFVGKVIGLCGVIMLLAYLNPWKTEDLLKDTTVSLPSNRCTLAELEAISRRAGDIDGPIRVGAWFTFAAEDAEKVIVFPSRTLTLRAFIESIESQSVLQHKFMHCGTGWSILRGGDCCMGLVIRDVELVGPPPYPRPRYERESMLAATGE